MFEHCEAKRRSVQPRHVVNAIHLVLRANADFTVTLLFNTNGVE